MMTLRCSLAFHLNFVVQVQVTVLMFVVQVQVTDWSESEGGFYTSQTARSYLRFTTRASACADWFSAWVTHESAFRLNLYSQAVCWGDAFNNNTKGPLTAVPMVSLKVLPNCPCFYRKFLWVWCSPYSGRKCCAKLHSFLLISFCLPWWVTWQVVLFWLTLICQFRSHDLIKLPLQFSTELSSPDGINYLKTRLLFDNSVWFLFYRVWRSYFS